MFLPRALLGWVLPTDGVLFTAIGLAALVGGWLTWRGFLADRARGRPRCPRCWYNMHLAPSLRCPECGLVATSPRALLRTRRHWRRAGLGLLLLLGPAAALGLTRYRQQVLNLILPRWWPVEWQTIAGYTIRTYKDRSTGWDRPMEICISRGGTTYATIEDQVVELGATGGTSQTRIGVGQDINGDKVPDLIVTQYSGGAHCCFSYTIISLEPTAAHVIAFLPADDGGAAFADVDGDGVYEIRVQESAFRYWNTSFVESPAPEVILRWNGAAYVLAPDLMAAPPLAEDELARRAKQIADIAASATPGATATAGGAASSAVGAAPGPSPLWNLSLLWRTMLELIYTGHPARAAAFLDQAWPPDLAGKEQFRRDFTKQLHTSRYWPALTLIEGYAERREK